MAKKYHMLWGVLLLSILGCASQPNDANQALQHESLPTTCKQAIEKIANGLDEDSINTLKQTKKKDLVKFHLSWGMGIRNSLDLWNEDSSVRKSCAQSKGEQDMHPDSVSSIIMEGVWELINP